jgi:hypothetical protein
VVAILCWISNKRVGSMLCGILASRGAIEVVLQSYLPAVYALPLPETLAPISRLPDYNRFIFLKGLSQLGIHLGGVLQESQACGPKPDASLTP